MASRIWQRQLGGLLERAELLAHLQLHLAPHLPAEDPAEAAL